MSTSKKRKPDEAHLPIHKSRRVVIDSSTDHDLQAVLTKALEEQMSQIRKEKEQEGKEKKEEEVVTLTGMCDKYLAELPPAMSKSSRIAAAIRHGTLVMAHKQLMLGDEAMHLKAKVKKYEEEYEKVLRWCLSKSKELKVEEENEKKLKLEESEEKKLSVLENFAKERGDNLPGLREAIADIADSIPAKGLPKFLPLLRCFLARIKTDVGDKTDWEAVLNDISKLYRYSPADLEKAPQDEVFLVANPDGKWQDESTQALAVLLREDQIDWQRLKLGNTLYQKAGLLCGKSDLFLCLYLDE